jgi:hypothetical protein
MADMTSLAGMMGGVTPSETETRKDKANRKPPPSRGGGQAQTDPVDEADGRSTDAEGAAAASSSAPTSVTKYERQDQVVVGRVVESAAQSLPTKAESGALLTVRVQPPEVGAWANEIMDLVSFVFGGRQGDAAGAILLIAQRHSAEIVKLLEQWGGYPTETIKKLAWEAWKSGEKERREQVSQAAQRD